MNYRELKRIIVSHIRDNTGHAVVLQGSNDNQPAYPFCSYTITSPYLPVSNFIDGGKMVEDIEFVFSFTWHSQDMTDVQDLSYDTAMLFKLLKHTQKLSDAGIAVVRIEGIQNRDVFLSVDSERRYGLDVRFRTRVIEEQGGDYIETVETPSQGGN